MVIQAIILSLVKSYKFVCMGVVMTGKKSVTRIRPWLVLFLPCLVAVNPARAQVVEEIIVTATKRETSLQDTAMSITALSEFELQRIGAEGIFDYGVKIPNLGFSNEADGRFNSGSPALRGVAGGGVVGATGFYIDDIPVPEYMDPRVSDISRVEVLRGPQGTLYGARSMGGTLRVITRQANAEELDGYLRSSVSDVKEGDINWRVDGSVNAPIVEGVLGMRALLYYAQNSGVFDRVHIAGSNRPAFDAVKNADDDEFYGGSIAFVWNAADNISIRPRFMYQRTDSDNLPLADLSPGNFEVPRHNNIEEPGEEEWWLGSVTVNIDTGFGEIVSTTARFDREVREYEDQTGTLDGLLFAASGLPEPHIPSFVYEIEEDTSVVHETRLISDFGDLPFDDVALTLGVFYEDRQHILNYPPSYAPGINEQFTGTLNAILTGIVPGFPVPVPPGLLGSDLVFTTYDDKDTEEIAVFGELSLRLSDKLRLTAGARWSETTIDFTADRNGFVNGGPAVVMPPSRSSSRVVPKVLLELDVTDDVLVYGSASKGFRVGGVNMPVPVAFCAAELADLGITNEDVATFDSDSLWNFEFGMKSSWFDERVNLNVSAFNINWDNTLQTNRLACGFQYVANSGEAENKGVEVELQAVPVEGLNISMGLGYTDAEITKGDPLIGTQEGDRILQVPEVTFNAAAEYNFPLFDDWEGYIRGDYSYYDDSLSANNVSGTIPPRVRDSFELLNFRIGAYQAGSWDLALFVKNATNEHANLSDNRSIAAEKPGRPRIVTNRPRSFGLEVRKDF